MRALLCLCIAVTACHRGADIVNHDPLSPEIAGLERLDQGAYQAGAVEHFRLIHSGASGEVHWVSSGGELVESGDEVAWTLPDSDEATLTASLQTQTRIATSTFRFRLSAGGGLTMSASPSGPIDASGALTGTYCDLAFDNTGNPVIAYRNDTHPAVWLARWSGSAWQTELVDGMGFETGGAVDYQISLALAPDGTPHVAYTYEDGTLHYATRSGAGWIRERVDTTIPRANDHYGFIGIALDSSRSNRPAIFYRTTNGNGYPFVVAATRSGTWTDTTLAANLSTIYGSYFFGGLAIDAAGVAYFSYYDYSNGGARVGAWAGNTADTGTTSALVNQTGLTNAPYEEPVALALDAVGKPILQYDHAAVHAKPGDSSITYSPFEENAVPLFDLSYRFGKPAMALVHNSLELISTDASGYWTYTNAGSADVTTGGRIGVAVDLAGGLHACFRRNGTITYQ